MRDGRHKHEGMEPDAAREYLDPWAHYFEEHHPQKIHHTGLTEAKVEEIMHYIIGSLRGAGAEATRDARLAGAPTGRPRGSRRRPGSSTAAARAQVRVVLHRRLPGRLARAPEQLVAQRRRRRRQGEGYSIMQRTWTQLPQVLTQ